MISKEWLRIYKDRTGAKLGTIRLREYGIIRLFPYFAHLKLKKIIEEMYQAALDNLKKRNGQNLARSTKEGVHTTGKMIFKMATRKKFFKDDPTKFAYIKKEQEVIVERNKEELALF
ncbi:hypothetical protein J11TS1_36090 [Oceanobacillus sp. J11TS1]|nr:hypothetical protein J11TS1_36090 [Oceanobacillus sp. J11TS1]